MEMTDIIQGGGLVLSGAAVTKLAGIAVKAWAARNGKTEVANDPLNVNKLDKYVTRGEFNKALERNDADHKRISDEAAADHERMERENNAAHENIFMRLTRNDRDMGEIKGLLTGVANDLQLIKGKLFKTR
ncbi:MAG: hypothetical protein KIH06_00435 [Kiritimatiellae bacterium]|nr:hypothetical protein [Kiritimatiellia bacterium]